MSRPLSPVAAVEQELAEIAARAPAVANGALAATARVLAARLENPKASDHAVANLSKMFMDALEQLRELAPPKPAASPLDEIRARRDAKLGLSDSPGRTRPRRGRSSAQ